MAGFVRQLKDDETNDVYPVTKAEATYMSGGVVSVETVLDDMQENSSVTEFPDDGSIKETLASGNIVTTTFLANGNIKETTKTPAGTVLRTKTTVFEADGSIKVNIVNAGEEQEETI